MPSGDDVVMLLAVCSLIVVCLCATMPMSLFWAREQSLWSRVFAVRVSGSRAILLISAVLWPFCFLVVVMEGRPFASAIAMSDAVLLRAVLAWLMGMQTWSSRPQYRRRVVTRGLHISALH